MASLLNVLLTILLPGLKSPFENFTEGFVCCADTLAHANNIQAEKKGIIIFISDKLWGCSNLQTIENTAFWP